MLLAIDREALCDRATDAEILEWRDGASHQDGIAVQVKTTPRGDWHKMLPDRTRTSCGDQLFAYATRDECLEGTLCPKCFTEYERALADRAHTMTPVRETKLRLAEESPLDEAMRESSPLVSDVSQMLEEGRRRRMVDGSTVGMPPLEKPVDPDED